MMETNFNPQMEDMLLISQLYPDVYSQMEAQAEQVEKKKQRRGRKKKKSEEESAASRKRKLSAEQVILLEQNFGDEHKLESERKDRLAMELGLDPRQVAVWFQNRRARWKTKKLEEEYSKLKNSHENVVLEKCQLQAEVVKLTERLAETENELQRLSLQQTEGISSSSYSPTSSLSMDVMDAPLFFDNVFYVPPGMEWVNNL